MSVNLLSTVKLGRYTLPNRIVMAPLTRNRAAAGNVPTTLNALHYEQRSSAGLLITEASQVSPQGLGYPNTPGIYSSEQVEGWRLVTNAVHAKGGKIFLQLWHVGRISHPDLQPHGELPVAPSAIAPEGEVATYTGMKPYVTPRALELEEIPQIIEQYRLGAKNALEAGFDGVEIHSANGYLLDQFLQDNTNHRTDIYGGSLENRARLLLEVTAAVVDVWGGDRVGLRLSPSGTFNSMYDSNRAAIFGYVAKELNHFNLAYLHLVAPRVEGFGSAEDQPDLNADFFRQIYNGTIITAGGYNFETGNEAIASGSADLVAFGRLYIANPDLVERFAANAPLNKPDRNTFYGGDAKGYTDYPTM
ncbi:MULTISPECIES: alkene reductase [Pseudanabaena]|uniref:12-oxophytodienoate reductase n=2 Tax=Pseudanabaena TaxID=1152 RepID=L8N043_9CYAN|nr:MULTISPECIES: alkene reductase [Pseudanabaena]ELS32394.1 12-oxophytodienoate reductase [Pseudanabaena biceps PCC 7429]MDG3495385.1 alkene reductase [Pseudanabaena catenata USMAC16]